MRATGEMLALNKGHHAASNWQVKRNFVAFVGLLFAHIASADATIQEVQQALKQQGFYYGNITGEKNADTTAAIRRFQIRNGLQVTGELNDETLRAVRSGASSATAQATPQATEPRVPPQANDSRTPSVNEDTPYNPPRHAPPTVPGVSDTSVFGNTPYETAPTELQRRVITGAQALLRKRGFYRGELDGVFGADLVFSLRAFQSRIGLVPSGRFDMDTLAALGLLPGQHGPPIAVPRRQPFPSQFAQPPVRGEWLRERPKRDDERDEDED